MLVGGMAMRDCDLMICGWPRFTRAAWEVFALHLGWMISIGITRARGSSYGSSALPLQ